MAVMNGIVLGGTLPIAPYAPPDIVCVASLAVPPDRPVGAPEAVLAWLRDCLAAGLVVASACSGALLLAEAELLDGGEATTHWVSAPGCASATPRCGFCRNACWSLPDLVDAW